MSAKREERLAQLQQQRDKLNRRISTLAAKEQAQRRKDATRRKILTGAALEAWAGDDQERQRQVRMILNKHVTAERDRKFLGLPMQDKQT